jgi:hypothetical protein
MLLGSKKAGKIIMFTVSCMSDKIWNTADLVGFLATNQHNSITLNINPEAICLKNIGLYDLLDKFNFKQVTIKTFNALEHHDKYNIVLKGPNFWFSRTAKIMPEFHTWDLSNRFLCFYHRPTAGRLGIASYVYKNYKDTSLIHFSTDDLVDFELDKLLSWNVYSAVNTASLLTKLPLLLGNTNLYTKFNGYDYNDPLTSLYKSILVDIVVETHVAGKTFFPTEKTVRPMLLKKPFIIFGSADYLAYLQQMGFRTFADFWDEDYDGYEAADRLLKIQLLIDLLASKSLNELEKMYWDMQYTLDHNYNLLMSQQYNKHIKEII